MNGSPSQNEAPLSKNQLELLRFVSRLGLHLNNHLFVRLTGRVNREALSSAIHDVVCRFDALSSVIDPLNSTARRVSTPEIALVPLDGDITDISLPEALKTQFDLSQDLPLRAFWQSDLSYHHLLVLIIHGIAFDAWSQRSFVRALGNAYEARANRHEPSWPPLSASYSTFAIRELEDKTRTDLPGRRRLPLFSARAMSANQKVSPLKISQRSKLPVRINPKLHREALVLARETRTGLVRVLQFAAAELLKRMGFGPAIAMSSIVPNRPIGWIFDAVGLFQGTISFRHDLSSPASIVEGINSLHREYVKTCAQEDLGALTLNDCSTHVMVSVRAAERHEFEFVSSDLQWAVNALPCTLEDVDIGFDFLEYKDTDGTPRGIEGNVTYNLAVLDRNKARAEIPKLASILAEAIEEVCRGNHRTDRPLLNGTNAEVFTILKYGAQFFKYKKAGNATQWRLLRMWEQVLGVSRISTLDGFLALGGDKQSAVAISKAIFDVYSVHVAPEVLMNGTTIEELSFELLRRVASIPVQLVGKSKESSRLPLYFWHGDFTGGGYYVRELLRFLPDDQPVYSFNPPGVFEGEIPESIEAMADMCIQKLQQVSPSGPYCLGGYCIGGLVALETARRLQSRGHFVPAVMLIASDYPDEPKNTSFGSGFQSARSPIERMYLAYLEYESRWHFYKPQSYRGPIRVMWPSDERVATGEVLHRWISVSPDATLATVPGTHDSCIRDYLSDIGIEIHRYLDTAKRSV